jgi:hypothetical protein
LLDSNQFLACVIKQPAESSLALVYTGPNFPRVFEHARAPV